MEALLKRESKDLVGHLPMKKKKITTHHTTRRDLVLAAASPMVQIHRSFSGT